MSNEQEEVYSVTVEMDPETKCPVSQFWRRDGLLHCAIGPAIIKYDRATGRVVQERWMRNDRTSRLEKEGPAVIHYDPDTGVAVRETYFADGNIHRLFGPADIVRDRNSGEVVSQSFYRWGKPFASHGPVHSP